MADGDYVIEAVQLEAGERTPMEMTERKRNGRIEKYAKAIEGILDGDFHAKPSPRECPRCPFYFVCPK